MPVTQPLYQEVHACIKAGLAGQAIRQSSLTRLALLVSGLIEGERAVPRRLAQAIDRLGVTRAQTLASIQRRLRRSWRDANLTAARCYHPVVRQVVADIVAADPTQPLVLIVDESSHTDRVHVLRLSLAYRGGSLPLAWASWAQNQPLGAGAYWVGVRQVLAETATLVPAGTLVIVVADRAYDVPRFVDAVQAQGWHWVVRAKANSALCFRDATGVEQPLRTLVRAQVAAPGQTWSALGAVFKTAGWRAARVAAVWAADQAERLVVLADPQVPADALDVYDRRFWIEPGFRNDKSAGWDWEAAQVRSLAAHALLLVVLAWATLLALALGAQVAATQLAVAAARPRRPAGARRPKRWEHARDSLFSLGRLELRRWLTRHAVGRLGWRLPDPHAPSWSAQWSALQQHRYAQTVPP
jgi:hypothetical protein